MAGTSTITSKGFNGGCFGFFKSNNSVKFGTIKIVRMKTKTIPTDNDKPTVCIGAIGVKIKEMKPIMVVTAERNTAFPVDFIALFIFSYLSPVSSA